MEINGVPIEIPEYPESEYLAIVRMPSAKFMRICKKLSSVGDRGDRDTVVIISVDKERVDFCTWGKAGTSTIFYTAGKPKEPTLIEEPILIEMKEKVSLTLDLST